MIQLLFQLPNLFFGFLQSQQSALNDDMLRRPYTVYRCQCTGAYTLCNAVTLNFDPVTLTFDLEDAQ